MARYNRRRRGRGGQSRSRSRSRSRQRLRRTRRSGQGRSRHRSRRPRLHLTSHRLPASKRRPLRRHSHPEEEEPKDELGDLGEITEPVDNSEL